MFLSKQYTHIKIAALPYLKVNLGYKSKLDLVGLLTHSSVKLSQYNHHASYYLIKITPTALAKIIANAK
ncbi:MAG: hypothetical protein ACI843_002464 [Psychrobacter glaciei]|jgi:hypothetical protein